jgi:hypothetical protein
MAKARTARLKVFRTPIGFHDAYVAAPSRKAALAAWGAGTDLFAAGAAEVVSDPKLTKEPLARPGEVIRKARGTDAEHVRALGPSHRSGTSTGTRKGKGKKATKEAGSRISSGMTKEVGDRPSPDPSRLRGGSKKRPSRAGVEKAERALERAEARHRDTAHALKVEEQALERRRRELERKQRGERERLALALDEAREQYRAAMDEWAG